MNDCKMLLIGEPTEFNIGVVENGAYWIKVKVKGKSAHGSRPDLGINAIEAAVSLFPKIKKAIPDTKHKLLNRSTINISSITGGMPFIVPEYCEFDFDYRLVPSIDANEIKKKFESIIAQFNKENDANAELEFVYSVPSIEFDKMTDFIMLLKQKTECFGAGNRIGLHYATDGGILVPKHMTPFVIFGPGRMDGLHVTNEWIEKDDVVKYSNILLDSIIECFSQ